MAGSLGLALLACGAAASASPMTYRATKFDHAGSFSYHPATIPDPAQGGRFRLGVGVPSGAVDSYVDEFGAVHETLDHPLSFVVDYGDRTIGEPGVVARLSVTGRVTGTKITNARGHYSGSFVGQATGIELAYPNGPPAADVPRPLLDLLAHPGRIRLEGFAGEGYGSEAYGSEYFSTYLTIAPAAPVPEPSALATLAAGIAGLAWRIRRRRTRRA